ncbi:MAG: ribosome small subunit-dependent GTPase A [Spirochaetales bacterium]|nr:ribosome small subunit-dependent GTPase A [Spirochaetales bacterium]
MEREHPFERSYPALVKWGWDREWGALLRADESHLLPGRVVRQMHHHYELVVAPEAARRSTEVSGAFAYRAAGPSDYPTVGDWVLIEPDNGRIQRVLERRGAVSRNVAGGETAEQVIAANIDALFLVFGLDGGRNFTVGMLERAAVVAWNSGARPVVVLNKADCTDEDSVRSVRREAEVLAPGVPVHAVSAVRGDGLDELLTHAGPGKTIGMLGKSGVGKSALLNAFARRAGLTEPAREGAQRSGDLQGRHTTTHKELYLIPDGPLVADVPGLRELQLWGDEEDLDAAFPEIEEFAAECRFSDCRHNGEPGCRVQEALATGELPHERYARYLDMQKELAYLRRRTDARAEAEEHRKWKRIAMEMRRYKGR